MSFVFVGAFFGSCGTNERCDTNFRMTSHSRVHVRFSSRAIFHERRDKAAIDGRGFFIDVLIAEKGFSRRD